MAKATLEEARTWGARIIEENGALRATAVSVGMALVAAEADGLRGHGLSRLATYVGMLKSGKIDGRALPAATHPRSGVLAIDAACGFAYPAIDLALAQLPAITKQNGLALAAIRRSNHAGALGLAVEKLADLGLVALMLANTPEAIAPWGGKRAVFGTNPIAFAAPLWGRPPVVIDLALSKVARGNIVAAKQKGEAIPIGWALDADGRATTDPTAALGGTMVAMGDAKGAALALMVEVMAGALVGAHLGFEASSFLDEQGAPPQTGQIIIAIDPQGMGGADFAERMTTLAAAIEAQDGARLPGSRRHALRGAANASGIEIAEALIAQFGSIRA